MGEQRGESWRLLLAHRLNKAFGLKPLNFLFKGVEGPGRTDFYLIKMPGLPGPDSGEDQMQEPDVRYKGNQRPLQLMIFYSGGGGGDGIRMLRWGRSSPAPPAPQPMPSPNKLPSCLAALLSVCPSAPPQTELTWFNTRAACPQPVGSATWQAGGEEKQLGHALGLKGQRSHPLALRGQDLEICRPGWPGAQSPSFVPDEVVVRGGGGGAAITPQQLGLSLGPAAVAVPPASSWASLSVYATPGPECS